MDAEGRELHERLRETQRIARLGDWSWDERTGRMHWSEELFRVYRQPVGPPPTTAAFIDLVHPDDREHVRDLIRAATVEGTSFANDHRLASDPSVVLHARGEARRDPESGAVHAWGSVQDVTELRAREAELRASEARYRALVEASSTAIVVRVEEEIVLANAAAARLWGAAGPDEVVGTSVLDTFLPEHEPRYWAFKPRILAGETIEGYQRVFLRRDGSQAIVEGHSSVVDWHGASAIQVELRDVTDRERRRTALRHAEERFRLALRHAPAGLAVTELDGTFSVVNETLCDIVGRDVEDLTNRTFASITHPDDVESDLAQLQRMTAGETDDYETEKRYLRPDGTAVPILLRASVVRDAEGRPEFLVASIVDLTERHVAERERAEHIAELTALNDELESAVAVKDHFLATATHDMRTPLTAILGFVEILRGPNGLSAGQQAEALDTIARQARRLDHLVGDLLSVAVIDGGALDLDRSVVPLQAVIAEVIADAGFDVPVQLAVAPDLTVHVDRDRFVQILLNLVTNALRYGAAPVEVSAEVDGGDPAWVTLRVRDTGPGVPEDFVARLFDRFSVANRAEARSVRGTGLGLAIVRALARAHGGDAWYEGDRTGACFAVQLPVHAESGLWRRDPDPTALVDPTLGRPALVVIGVDTAQERWAKLAESFTITPVADVADALRVVGAGAPDLVLAGLDLPSSEALAVVAELTQDLGRLEVPVVLLAARPAPETVAQALAMGIADVVDEAVDPVELMARLGALHAAAARNRALRQLTRELAASSHVDRRTGLHNRRGIQLHLERLASFARRHREPVAAVRVELDPRPGDDPATASAASAASAAVLEAVTRAIRGQIRIEDVAGSWQGEQLVVLMPGTDLTGGALAAERIRAAVEALPVSVAHGVTVCAGVAATESGDLAGALAEADRRVRLAQTSGGNQVR